MGTEVMGCCGALTRVYSQGQGGEPRRHNPGCDYYTGEWESWNAQPKPLGSGTIAQELGKLATLTNIQKQRMDLRHMPAGEWHANLDSARRLLKHAQRIVDLLEGEEED